MLDASGIFDRYNVVRHRLPFATTQNVTHEINSLLDLTDQIDAFVFDAFGVLNIGDVAIPGAVDRITELREAGAKIRVLTNAATYNRDATDKKFKRLGFSFTTEEIITSRSSALNALDARHWGIIAACDDPLDDIVWPYTRLLDRVDDYGSVEGFLFLSTSDWSEPRQVLLEDALAQKPRRIVVANADLAAPRGTSFTIEPGFWGHQISDRLSVSVEFHGKPFPGVFELASRSLGKVDPDRIALCGDSLHTDVLGATAAGWRSIFVFQDGLFKQLPTSEMFASAKIQPSWQVPRI